MKPRRILLALCLILATPRAGLGGADPEAGSGPTAAAAASAHDDSLRVAHDDLAGGAYQRAADGFEALLALTPSAELAALAGLARYLSGALDLAERHATDAIAQAPEDGRAWELRGLVRLDAGRHREGIADLERALALPRSGVGRTRVLVALVTALVPLGRLQDAAARLAEAEAEEDLAGVADVARGRLLLLAAGADPTALRSAVAELGLLLPRWESTVAASEAELGLGDIGAARGGGRRAAQELAEDPLPPLALAGAQLRIALLLGSADDADGAEALLALAVPVLESAGAEASVADVHAARARWAMERWDVDAAERANADAVRLLERLDLPVARALARLVQASVVAVRGDLAAGEAECRAALDGLRALRHRPGELSALLCLAQLSTLGGDPAAGLEHGAEALKLAVALRLPRAAAQARAARSEAHARLGALDDALTERGLARSSSRSDLLITPRSAGGLDVAVGQAALRAGRYDLAHDLGRSALLAVRSAPAADVGAAAEELVVTALIEWGRTLPAREAMKEFGRQDPRLLGSITEREAVDRYNLGVDRLDAGELRSALETFSALAADEAAPAPRRQAAHAAVAQVATEIAAASLTAGDHRAAMAAARTAQRASEAVGDEDGVWAARLLEGEAALDGGLTSEALSQLSGCARVVDGSAVACFDLLSRALFDTDPEGARRAILAALAAPAGSSSGEGAVARRALLTYNLAVLEAPTSADGGRSRLQAARSLASAAGDQELLATIEGALTDVEDLTP